MIALQLAAQCGKRIIDAFEKLINSEPVRFASFFHPTSVGAESLLPSCQRLFASFTGLAFRRRRSAFRGAMCGRLALSSLDLVIEALSERRFPQPRSLSGGARRTRRERFFRTHSLRSRLPVSRDFPPTSPLTSASNSDF